MKYFSKKFICILVGIICVIFLGIIMAIGIIKKSSQESKIEPVVSSFELYIEVNPIVKLDFNTYCIDKICDKAIVTNFELVNNDAKEIFKETNFNNMELREAISLIYRATIENKELDTMVLYTTWTNENYWDNFQYKEKIDYRVLDSNEFSKIVEELTTINYQVNFYNDDGTLISTQTIKEGEKISKPSDPIKEGYNFKGWLYNDVQYDFEMSVINDMNLYATWEKISEPIVENNQNTQRPNETPPSNSTNPEENEPITPPAEPTTPEESEPTQPTSPTLSDVAGTYVVTQGDYYGYFILNSDGTFYFDAPGIQVALPEHPRYKLEDFKPSYGDPNRVISLGFYDSVDGEFIDNNLYFYGYVVDGNALHIPVGIDEDLGDEFGYWSWIFTKQQ